MYYCRVSRYAGIFNEDQPMKFINQTRIRKYCNRSGKRISKNAMILIDGLIAQYLELAISAHDGGKKTIDDNLLIALGFPVKKGINGKH